MNRETEKLLTEAIETEILDTIYDIKNEQYDLKNKASLKLKLTLLLQAKSLLIQANRI